jgi:glycine/D-amino acid oxidase-like deaminating enzyme
MAAQHDVVIIGGAIGLWAAYCLKTRSRACRVAVVERDFAGPARGDEYGCSPRRMRNGTDLAS